jgi:hypothetical protein
MIFNSRGRLADLALKSGLPLHGHLSSRRDSGRAPREPRRYFPPLCSGPRQDFKGGKTGRHPRSANDRGSRLAPLKYAENKCQVSSIECVGRQGRLTWRPLPLCALATTPPSVVLPACQMVFDVIGDLITHVRQRKQLVLDDRIVGLARQAFDTWPLGPVGCQSNQACRTQYC